MLISTTATAAGHTHGGPWSCLSHGGARLLGRLPALCLSHDSFSLRTSTVSTKPTSMILWPLVTSAPASRECVCTCQPIREILPLL